MSTFSPSESRRRSGGAGAGFLLCAPSKDSLAVPAPEVVVLVESEEPQPATVIAISATTPAPRTDGRVGMRRIVADADVAFAPAGGATVETVFPGESDEYRAARQRLLEQEIELRRAMERVAETRRAL